QHRQERRLPAARRTGDRHVFAALNVDRDIVERARLLVAVALEDFADVLEADDRHVRIDNTRLVGGRPLVLAPPRHQRTFFTVRLKRPRSSARPVVVPELSVTNVSAAPPAKNRLSDSAASDVLAGPSPSIINTPSSSVTVSVAVRRNVG